MRDNFKISFKLIFEKYKKWKTLCLRRCEGEEKELFLFDSNTHTYTQMERLGIREKKYIIIIFICYCFWYRMCYEDEID